jgi:putative glycerol-1-phosphate prenyltransferase
MTPASSARLPFDERGGLVVLIDPGRTSPNDARLLASRAREAGACGLLVGDSLGQGANIAEHVGAIRSAAPTLPIVQFPAAADDLTPEVDAVLFLVLISGRNPRYLIEEQVRATAFFRRYPTVAAVSTAYLLVDGGRESTVEHVSRTEPLGADDIAGITAHVAAGRLMGLTATYLEAGSGAVTRVSDKAIAAARAETTGPLIVGGGITSPDAARAARRAGADYVVVGTLFERDPAAAVDSLARAART